MNHHVGVDPHRDSLRRHLEGALADSTEPEVRYHIRQALQLVA